MEDSGFDTVSDERPVDLSEVHPKVQDTEISVPAVSPPAPKRKKPSPIPACLFLSLLMFTVGVALWSVMQSAQSTLWEIKAGDVYTVSRVQKTHSFTMQGDRILKSDDISDPSVLVSSIFILSTTSQTVDFVVFLGEVDSSESEGLFSVWFSDSDDDKCQHAKTLPLVRVKANKKSGQIYQVQAPYKADENMVKIAETLAMDVLLNRDPVVYFPVGNYLYDENNQTKCMYPEYVAGDVYCPEYSQVSVDDSTIYTKVYSDQQHARRLSSNSPLFSAAKSAYVNKKTGELTKTHTIGNLTVQVIGTNLSPQSVLVQQESSAQFSIKSQVLSKSDIELFKTLIETRISMKNVTQEFQNSSRLLSSEVVNSVSLFNLLGFQLSLQTDLIPLSQAVNITVNLLIGNNMKVRIATGLIGGDVQTAISKVRSLGGSSASIMNDTLVLATNYAKTGINTWSQALWTADQTIWAELNLMDNNKSGYETAVNASLQWQLTTISQIVNNYTTFVRTQISNIQTQILQLNDSLTANQTAVSVTNQTLEAYRLQYSEIYAEIQDLTSQQINDRNQEQSLLIMINQCMEQLYGKQRLQHFNATLVSFQSGENAWIASLAGMGNKLAGMLQNLQGEVSRYNQLIYTTVPSLASNVTSELAPLDTQLFNLTAQLNSLTSQVNSLQQSIDSISPVLADVNLQLNSSGLSSADFITLQMQQTDLLQQINSSRAAISALNVQINLVNSDIANVQGQYDGYLQGYQTIGFTEANIQNTELRSQLALIASLTNTSAALLTSVENTNQLLSTILSAANTTNFTSSDECSWLSVQIASLTENIKSIESLIADLQSLNQTDSSTLSDLTVFLTQNQGSLFFTNSDVLTQALVDWRVSMLTRIPYVQDILTVIFPVLQSSFLSSNATVSFDLLNILQQLPGVVTADYDTVNTRIAQFQSQYTAFYAESEVTIPAQLLVLEKQLNDTFWWIQVTNATLMQEVNNKTVTNPMIPVLQAQVKNWTIVMESIQNHTFSWQNVFSQMGVIDLGEVFQVQAQSSNASSNLTAIQQAMSTAYNTISNSISSQSGALSLQSSNLASGFINIDQFPVIPTPINTGSFLNFSALTTALQKVASLFNSTDGQLWNLQTALQTNVTAMVTFLHQNITTRNVTAELQGVMEIIKSVESLYLVNFSIPLVITTASPLTPLMVNQTAALLETFSIAPLIKLYESRFSASLNLIRGVVSNGTQYIDNYLSLYTSPLTLDSENFTSAYFVLGPLCTPLGCILLTANMSLLVDLYTGVRFDGQNLYAMFSPKTLGSFSGLGLLTLGSTRIEVALFLQSPIIPTYSLSLQKNTSFFHVDGSVLSNYQGSVQLLLTSYEKLVSSGCWSIVDGKAYRKLCLSWQRLYMDQPDLMWKKSFSSSPGYQMLVNQTFSGN